MYHIFFIDSSVNGHLGRLCVSATGNTAAGNVEDMSLFELQFCLDICPGVGWLIVWYFYFYFLRNFDTVLYCVCFSLRSHGQCKEVSFSPHSFHHLLVVDFLMMAI